MLNGLWLSFFVVAAVAGLSRWLLGDDPAAGKARLCTTLRFTYRGEWKAPPTAVMPTAPLEGGHARRGPGPGAGLAALSGLRRAPS